MRWAGTLVAVALAVSPVAAGAQSLAVSPTTIDVPAGKHGAVMQITNTMTTPVDVQVRPYDWHQAEGKDVLTDSTTLRVSPSIVTIPAGSTQLLRMLIPAGERGVEGDWRVVVDQLPRPASGGGLQIRLRLSIPVFARAATSAPADVRWSLRGGQLEAVNAGLKHVRFATLELRPATGAATTLPLGESPYLLPGTRRAWTVTTTPATLSVAGTWIAERAGATAFVAPVALDRVR
ncbi:MAG: fimbrial biogenesis chaperone [Janthinobacterium lividum]